MREELNQQRKTEDANAATAHTIERVTGRGERKKATSAVRRKIAPFLSKNQGSPRQRPSHHTPRQSPGNLTGQGDADITDQNAGDSDARDPEDRDERTKSSHTNRGRGHPLRPERNGDDGDDEEDGEDDDGVLEGKDADAGVDYNNFKVSFSVLLPELYEFSHTGVQLAIRQHLKKLMNVQVWAQLPRKHLPLTAEELDAYLAEEVDAPTVSATPFLRIDFAAGWKLSPYNQEVRTFFVTHFLAAVKGGAYAHPQLLKTFLTEDHVGIALDNHMKHLRKRYRDVQKESWDEIYELEKRRKARNTRKTTVSALCPSLHIELILGLQLLESRVDVLLRRGLLHRHLQLFAHISARHLSGDETDGPKKTHPPIFSVNNATWMSEELRTFFRFLDELYRDDWSRDRKPGNPPRTRISRGDSRDVAAPKGLHRNCYSQDWLKNLKPHQFKNLRIVAKDWDFAIPDDMESLNADVEM